MRYNFVADVALSFSHKQTLKQAFFKQSAIILECVFFGLIVEIYK